MKAKERYRSMENGGEESFAQNRQWRRRENGEKKIGFRVLKQKNMDQTI